ncbi:hypothetical protein [Prochlorococcus sp. MIT 0916]|uniref:hypothetical protein n=1 Tax=Prochlorococcus sp. MIT 0916 TaxID=3082521 RepID=UPI0039B6B7C7
MYFACIKFASQKELVALKIYTNPPIPKIWIGENLVGSCFINKEIVNFYQQPEQHPQKNLLFRGGLLLLRPELAVASRAKSLT